jgi:DNA invertase Pin-like site-specific DNA recombinase
MKPRGLLYLRLSRALGDPDDPEQIAALLAAHRAALLRLAEQDGVPVAPADIIEEIGSGEYLRERPRFQALVERWERERWDDTALYTVAIDRLSRASLAEVGRIMEALVHAGIEVRTPQRRYDLSQPDDELFYAFLAALSRHELGRYRQRVAAKWREMTLAGEIVSGGDRYGYRWDKNLRNLVPVEPAFSVVCQLFTEALTLSVRRLAARHELPEGTVYNILHNPVYCGWPARHLRKVIWRGGQGKPGGRRLPPGEWLWPEQSGRYPAACTREQFLLVQAALQERERERTKTGSTNGWCRDVVQFAARPGARIDLGSHHAAAGIYLTYTTRPGEGSRLYVDRERVHARALPALAAVFARPAVLAAAVAARAAREPAARSARSPEAVREALAARRAWHDELLRREGTAADEEERASLTRVRTETRAEIRALARELQAVTPAAALSPSLLAALPRAGSHFAAAWAALPEAGRRALAREVLAAVVVRITPQPHPRPWLREVVEVHYAEWLAPYMDPHGSASTSTEGEGLPTDA